MNKVPKQLQSILWSTDVRLLDLERDKNYIIHQTLSYGRFGDIRWLFQTYPKDEIKKVFTRIPYKDYTASRFYFVRKYLLGLAGAPFDERRYVKNTPRRLD